MRSFVLFACLALLGARADAQAVPRTSSDHPQPGDMIRVRVSREPELSGDFQIDEDANVVFPRIGMTRVGGISVDSVKRIVIGAYARFLIDPSIEVRLLRRIAVSGAVRSPNLYSVDETMTVSDVISLAGGATPEGRDDRVELFRGGTRIDRAVDMGAIIGKSVVHSGDRLVVPQRNWFARNAGVVASALGAIGLVIATIVANR